MGDLGRLPLVYIASTGRSGSTLLEMLLDTHPQLMSVGEFQLLPFELADPDARCGCGRLLTDCPFWAPLRNDPALASPTVPLDLVRESRDTGRTLRPRLLASVLTNRGARTGAIAHRYGQANAVALRAVAARDPGSTLVDASKDVYRLHLLARSGNFDLRVVHLVRDPRAVVHSFRGASADRRTMARTALRWTVQQELFTATLRHLERGSVARVRYEDLVSAPDATLGLLARHLDVDPTGFDLDFRSSPGHAIAGNPTRWRSDPIRADDRWEREMSTHAQRLTWRLTAPVATRFGYSAL